MRKIVSNILGEQLERFFMEHPDVAKVIVDKAIVASKARLAAKKARELTRRKSALEDVYKRQLQGDLGKSGHHRPEIRTVGLFR